MAHYAANIFSAYFTAPSNSRLVTETLLSSTYLPYTHPVRSISQPEAALHSTTWPRKFASSSAASSTQPSHQTDFAQDRDKTIFRFLHRSCSYSPEMQSQFIHAHPDPNLRKEIKHSTLSIVHTKKRQCDRPSESWQHRSDGGRGIRNLIFEEHRSSVREVPAKSL